MENIYKFSKDSNHVKFFKWLLNIDPVKSYKTMCPYFWTYVLVVITLPVLLVVKAVRSFYNSKWYKKLRNRKNEKRRLKNKDYIDSMVEILYTEEDVLILDKVFKGKKYSKFYYDIKGAYANKYGYTSYTEKIKVLSNYRYSLLDKQEEEQYNKKRRRQEIKAGVINSKLFIGLNILVATVLVGFVFYGGYWLYEITNWYNVFKISLYFIGIIIGGIIGYKLIDIIGNLIPKTNKNYIKLFFKSIKHIFLIIIDMIYSTYKKRCPIITWEEPSTQTKD